MEDRILPEGIDCPYCKDDCDGCGGCGLVKYYEDKEDENEDEDSNSLKKNHVKRML